MAASPNLIESQPNDPRESRLSAGLRLSVIPIATSAIHDAALRDLSDIALRLSVTRLDSLCGLARLPPIDRVPLGYSSLLTRTLRCNLPGL
jgi:hypothetical protein